MTFSLFLGVSLYLKVSRVILVLLIYLLTYRVMLRLLIDSCWLQNYRFLLDYPKMVFKNIIFIKKKIFLCIPSQHCRSLLTYYPGAPVYHSYVMTSRYCELADTAAASVTRRHQIFTPICLAADANVRGFDV